MDIFQNPIVVALLIGLPSAALGYLGYRRSLKVDKVAEQAGAAATDIAQVGQVISGLNQLVEKLQQDNTVLRQEIADLRTRTKELSENWETLQSQIVRLNDLYRVAVARDQES